MATYHQELTIPADKSISEPFQLGPHHRVVGITTMGDWDETCTVGLDIQIDSKPEWYPVIDGIKGERAHVAGMISRAFHIIPDYGHPLSDVGDDKIRVVCLGAHLEEKPTREERKLKLCIRIGD